MAVQLEEELELEESRLRGVLISIGVLLVVAFGIALALRYFVFDEESASTRATEDLTVARATIASTLAISGISETQLSSDLAFQSSGKVDSVTVNVGDRVIAGQVLATQESEDLTNGVASARANQLAARLRLDDLLAGSTPAELAAANQAVEQARGLLVKAQSDETDLLDGASVADIATAEQAVFAAQAQLASALSAQQKVDDGASDADVLAAEAGVAAADAAVTAAENSASNAENTVTSAGASLRSAETAYCGADNAPSFCGSGATPISNGDESLLDAALGGANATLASSVIAANSAYLNAVNGADSAEAAVDSAQNALDSAEAKLDALEDGASTEDAAAADAAVSAADAALQAADDFLADVLDGPDPTLVNTARAAVVSAQSALDSASARRAEAVRGSEPNEIEQARAALDSARLTVEAAEIRLKNAQIIAPFDGTVGAVNVSVGEFIGLAATTPPIVLLTPDRVLLRISVGETDYPNVKIDQGGVAIFDGLPGKPYPFRISEIGLSPTVTQGVVTYNVKADLAVLPGNPNPAPGMNGRGQITTDSKEGILVLPPRAIRRKGNDQVVDLRRDGEIIEQVVTTGVTDTANVEILTGVEEGDIVVVPLLTTTEGTTSTQLRTPLPGGVR